MGRIRTLLVANRGEIARRILRACREAGIRGVAVFSEADRHAPYVTEADEAHLLGPAPPAESYLRTDRILEAARRAKADAVHPGYGFLAENPDFADAVANAGLRFVGPGADAIRRVGNKILARGLASRIGVPVVPGTDRPAGRDSARAFCAEHGFPALLKAAAGGGGRGMRVVWEAGDLDRALDEAAREAAAAFGDGSIFVERYIQRGRHVEIQVLADSRGTVAALGERECSIQRRHQKLVEESPCPTLAPQVRAAMSEAACRLLREAGYVSAGTVEFLVEPDGAFHFLEVNTRLQVEHPVTELVTGVDIVLEQIRVAEGEPLSFDPATLAPRGHAIEVRICAEDPYARFTPSIGRIDHVALPGGPGVRVDTDLAPGVRVTPHYDSLLAKLVCWGADRTRALSRLARALDETLIVGVPTTIPVFRALLDDPAFRDGQTHTRFLGEFMKGFEPPAELLERAVSLAAALESLQTRRLERALASGEPVSRWKHAILESP